MEIRAAFLTESALGWQNKLPGAELSLYPGEIKSRSLCEKDAFVKPGVICFHTAVRLRQSIACNLQETRLRHLTVPFGLKIHQSEADLVETLQLRGGLFVSLRRVGR